MRLRVKGMLDTVKRHTPQKVSMIGKYHNHPLQINPGHLQEEPQNTNSHKTSERQL